MSNGHYSILLYSFDTLILAREFSLFIHTFYSIYLTTSTELIAYKRNQQSISALIAGGNIVFLILGDLEAPCSKLSSHPKQRFVLVSLAVDTWRSCVSRIPGEVRESPRQAAGHWKEPQRGICDCWGQYDNAHNSIWGFRPLSSQLGRRYWQHEQMTTQSIRGSELVPASHLRKRYPHPRRHKSKGIGFGALVRKPPVCQTASRLILLVPKVQLLN